MSTQNKFGREGWTPDQIDSLAGKTYLITGATNGTGFQAARVFLAKGATVVMLNRNAEKSAEAISTLKQEFGDEADVRSVQMDLAVLDSVKRAAAEVLERTSQIDALICNAAIAQVANQEITVDGFESQLGVNHFGHFLLCGLLFDRIEASNGRIVVVGSTAYKMGLKKIQFEDLNFDTKYTAWNAYAQSKLAQLMFAYELQRRVQAAGKNVIVQVCHPGAAKTNLLQDTASRFNKILWSIMAPLVAQSAEKGSYPQVMCAVDERVESGKLYGPTKRSDMVGPVGENEIDDCVMNQDMAAKLWRVSEEKTSLSWSP